MYIEQLLFLVLRSKKSQGFLTHGVSLILHRHDDQHEHKIPTNSKF